jgi:serine/threonine protein kinase HipA of HipAB toxin-antitoxin module
MIRNGDEMLFEDGISQSEDRSSHRSGLTGSSSTTFRDTQIDQLQSDHLMHVQNLTSIVNNPKKKGIFQKAKDLYLQ